MSLSSALVLKLNASRATAVLTRNFSSSVSRLVEKQTHHGAPPRAIVVRSGFFGKLGGAARAQERLDFIGRAGRGEEIALTDAAARVDQELALRVRLDALGDD